MLAADTAVGAVASTGWNSVASSAKARRVGSSSAGSSGAASCRVDMSAQKLPLPISACEESKGHLKFN